MSSMEMEVYGIGVVYVGTANGFGAAKRMQQASLPADLRDAYAGIQDGMPIFYREMLTPELRAKYPQLAD